MIDEGFTCVVCHKKVDKLNYTARDHCNSCLCSLHVDNFPGDRECSCMGVLIPIGMENGKKGCRIVYKCRKCKTIKKNIAAIDDNMDLIIKLSANPLSY